MVSGSGGSIETPRDYLSPVKGMFFLGEQSNTKVYICRGKDCRRRGAFLEQLRRSLPDDLELNNVRCQKICKGAVVGVNLGKRLIWFKRLKSKKDLRRIRVFIEEGKLPKGLKKKLSKKQTDRLRV